MVQIEIALQISFIRHRVYESLVPRVTLCRRGKTGPNFAGDPLRDLILQPQDVLKIALVAIRPEMLIGASIYQLRSDADPVTGAHDGAFDDGIHSKLLCDVGQRAFGVSIAFHRSVGDDSKF